MLYFAIFLISLSSLAIQVLLTRLFSIGQWNHLSFMVISIALFGFGASGTFLSLVDTRKHGWEKILSSTNAFRIFFLVYSLTVIAAFLVLNNIPLDYFRLPIEPVQAIYLLCAYLVLSLPYFITGMVISIAFAAFSKDSGLVYFSTMTGSACGAIFPVLLLPFIEEGILLVLCAMIPLLYLLVSSKKEDNSPRTKQYLFWSAGLSVAFLGIFLIGAKDGDFVRINPSPYKGLSQMLKFPDTHVARAIPGIHGRIDAVESPYIRFAPGLSLKFQERLPEQSAIFLDADSPLILYQISSNEDLRFAKHSLSYSGYVLVPQPGHVLVIQSMGGSGIPFAMASKADKITVLERHPAVAKIVTDHYQVNAIHDNPRAFLSRHHESYSIIHIEHHGPSIPGTAALNQEHLFTVDAFINYLKHLDPNGVIILSGKLILPPSNTIRLWAGAYEAIRFLGKDHPEHHLAMLRNWDSFTLIISKEPILDSGPLISFAADMNFDLVYLPQFYPDLVNRFNEFEKPYFFQEIEKLKNAYLNENESQYFANSLLDTSPQWDNRPFPNRFLKWSRIKELYESTGSRLYGLLLSGEIVVVVVFFEAVLVAFFLLAVPLSMASSKGPRPKFSHLIFFLGIGAGFMFAELYFIKQYTFLFGNPTIAFMVVLAGILLFSGAGGYLSQKMNQSHLQWSIIMLVCLFLLIFTEFENLLKLLLELSTFNRYAASFFLLVPVGLLMGIPFSIGMRLLLSTALQRAYAWAANGCASVLTSILSAQIAISQGVSFIIILAAFAYFLSLLGCKTKISRIFLKG